MIVANLRHKQVLIPSGSSGIGYEIAFAITRCGANIMLTDLNTDAAEKAAAGARNSGVECRP